MFPQGTALGKMRVPVLLCVLACLCAAAGPLVGADRSCTDLRQFYTSKGFTLSGVPQTEISGRWERNTLTCPNHHLTSECCENINYLMVFFTFGAVFLFPINVDCDYTISLLIVRIK